MCPKSVNLPTRHPFPPDSNVLLEAFKKEPPISSISTDGRGTKGQERGQKSWSCRAWTPSCLQTTEVRLPQDSVDVVIGDIAVVAMETMLQGASRFFRLWAEGVLADAVVLAVYAGPGEGHYCSLGTTDPITAVAAGRL